MKGTAAHQHRSAVTEVGLFRLALGLYLLYYYATLMPHFLLYFGPGSMVRPDLLPPPKLSLLFLVWQPVPILLLLTVLVCLIVCFAIGLYPKRVLLPLWVLHLAFHHGNPLIIHEPQQLANLFLLFGFFLPLDSPPVLVRRSRPPASNPMLPSANTVVTLLVIYLGVYYFFAGLKKLPDPLWRDGTALSYIFQWPALAKPNDLTGLIASIPLLSMFLTYATLAFELSFGFLVFTPVRVILISVGLLFHLLLGAAIEVGSFPQIMAVWYTLLLNEGTRQRYGRMWQRARQRVLGGNPADAPPRLMNAPQ